MNIIQANSRRAPLIVIYGGEGLGKSTLGSKFRKPVFLDLEHGLPRGVTVDAIGGVSTFQQFISALSGLWGKTHDYQTLVVDTVDQLEAMVHDAVCAEHGWKNIETPSFGKGWVAADIVWRRVLRALLSLRDERGMTIVLIGHSTIERVDDPRAPSFSSYNLRLHRRARALILDAGDVVGFLATDLRTITEDGGFRERTRAAASPTRFLFLEGTPAFVAKNRYDLPPKIEIPRNFNTETLLQYFETTTPEGA